MDKILVVDDEAKIREVIREYAEFEGHSVMEAGDGMEAVNLCKTQDFDIIVMDIMMPKLDGFSASKDYVVKPFSPKELMARIHVIINRHLRKAQPSVHSHRSIAFKMWLKWGMQACRGE